MFLQLFRSFRCLDKNINSLHAGLYAGSFVLNNWKFSTMANKLTLEEQIKEQGDLVRSLKSQKADKEKVLIII